MHLHDFMTKKISKQTYELTLMHTFDKNSGMKSRQLYLYRGSISQRFDKIKRENKIKNNQKIMPLVHT